MPEDKLPDIHAIRFLALVDSLYHAAMTFLGKVADPETGETVRELDKAQVYIDFIATIEKKTKNNLSKPEKEHLERILGSLRLNYVDELERQKKGEEAGAVGDEAEAAGEGEKRAKEEGAEEARSDEEENGPGEKKES